LQPQYNKQRKIPVYISRIKEGTVPKVNYKHQKRQKEIAKKKKRDEKLKRKQEKEQQQVPPAEQEQPKQER
jgi:hypothetical protein